MNSVQYAIDHLAEMPISASVVFPEFMDLESNFKQTIGTLQKLRGMLRSQGRGKSRATGTRFHIDFKPLRRITAPAALLLAAELDRWNRLHPALRMQALDVLEWHPEIIRQLKQFGFFRILQVEEQVESVEPKTGTVTFLPFVYGEKVEGAAATELQNEIKEMAGDVENPHRLYDGIVEAMTNVKNHAYATSAKLKGWWMSASFDAAGRWLTVMVLDHGRGIPVTLPRMTRKENISGVLQAALHAIGVNNFHNDAAMIEVAVTMQRSATGLPYRGQGLKNDIKDYIERYTSAGRLRIISNRGEFEYTNAAGDKESSRRQNRFDSIEGTFIEWTIQIPKATSNEAN